MIKTRKIKQKLIDLYRFSGQKSGGLIEVNIDLADEIFANKNVEVLKIVEEEKVAIKPANCLEEDRLLNYQPFESISKCVLLDIRDSEFSFRHSHLLDSNLNVIYEPGIDFSKFSIFKRLLPRCKRVKGTVAYLSNTATNHYGHWLQHTLPLIRFYWEIIGKQNIDYYYLGDCPISSFQIETLNLLDISQQQIINYPCQAERLLTAIKYRSHQNGGSKYTDIASFRFIRDLFSLNNNSNYKKIYVQRGNVKHRKVVNENEILTYLDKLGFVPLVMDGRSVREQVDLFSNADVIIAPHGSALHNVIFASSNTKVIELFPFNYHCTANFTFASYANTNYYYANGDKISPDYISPIDADIKINISKLEKVLKLANII